MPLLHKARAQSAKSVMGRTFRSETIRARQKRRLVDRFQQEQNRPLRHLVFQRRHTPSELHSYPIGLWDPLKSSTRFIPCVGSGSSS